MKRAAIILGLLPVAALFAACEGDTNTTVMPEEEAMGVTVAGVGEINVPPDIAVFTVGVEVRSPAVGTAREEAAQLAAAVIASVKSNGVADADIQTAALYVQPEYNYPSGGGQPTVVGYIVTNTLSVKVRDLSRLNATIDQAIDAGGDASRLQGVAFQLDDDTEAKATARERAMADAKAKAEQLARLGGVTLGAPIAISEDVQTAQPIDVLRLADVAIPATGSAYTSTPIETGSGTIRVNVVVRWAIAE